MASYEPRLIGLVAMGWRQNFSESARSKEFTGVSLSGQRGVFAHCEVFWPQVKDKHTSVVLQSWPFTRLELACWKGHWLDVIHLFSFARPTLLAFLNDIKVSFASLESRYHKMVSWCRDTQSYLTWNGSWDKRPRCFSREVLARQSEIALLSEQNTWKPRVERV